MELRTASATKPWVYGLVLGFFFLFQIQVEFHFHAIFVHISDIQKTWHTFLPAHGGVPEWELSRQAILFIWRENKQVKGPRPLPLCGLHNKHHSISVMSENSGRRLNHVGQKGGCWLLYLHALFIFRTIAHNMSKPSRPSSFITLKIKHKSFRFDEIKRSPHITSFS